MAASLSFMARLSADSLHGVAGVLDRGLRLQHVAVRNAARAVAADRVAAILRADAAAALAASESAPARELSLVGA
jgi:hypothetical protein